jgi:hypothetical protein
MSRPFAAFLVAISVVFMLPGCCFELRISPCCGCRTDCSPREHDCSSACGVKPGTPRPPLPNTPMTIAELRNKKGSGRVITSAKVRGYDNTGSGATNQFAAPPPPPAGGSYSNNWFPFPNMPLDSTTKDVSSFWRPAPSPAPQSVRNVEMEIVIDVGGTPRTYVLEITAPDGCAEASSGLRKMMAVQVMLVAVDATSHQATFKVWRKWYNSDSVDGCGVGDVDCSHDTDDCVVSHS